MTKAHLVPLAERNRIWKKYKDLKEKAELDYEKKLVKIDTAYGKDITRAVAKLHKAEAWAKKQGRKK